MNDSGGLCFFFFYGLLGVEWGEEWGVLKKGERERERERSFNGEREREGEAWGSKEM